MAKTEQTLEQIKQNAIKISDIKCGIYFLWLDDEIVYVGQCKGSPYTRIGAHIDSEKEFDSFSFIPCKLDELNNLEAENIIKFKPFYNGGLPPNDRYMSKQTMAKVLKVTQAKVNKAIKNITPFHIGGCTAYDILQVKQALH